MIHYKPKAPKTLTHPMARIANVQCTRLKFEPGDRVIVRVYQTIGAESEKKLRRSVEKWAGDVEVLIVDCTLFDVEIDKSKGLLL